MALSSAESDLLPSQDRHDVHVIKEIEIRWEIKATGIDQSQAKPIGVRLEFSLRGRWQLIFVLERPRLGAEVEGVVGSIHQSMCIIPVCRRSLVYLPKTFSDMYVILWWDQLGTSTLSVGF